ncbi:MAG: NAD(P)-binding protein, partial [Steroidobacteraceae bacterium]
MNVAQSFDVAIIGGGPAGAAAAIATRSCQLDVCLIDEQPRLGGQIYRQPPAGFRVDSWLTGKAYARGKLLLARAEQLSGLRHIPSATTWGIFPAKPEGPASGGHHVLFQNDAGLGRISARHVLLSTGCYEMPVPFRGWHLPGVMSAGGIQTLMKSQRVAAAANIVLAGSHPLLLIVAEQLLEAGVRIAAVAFMQPFSTVWRLLRYPLTTLS